VSIGAGPTKVMVNAGVVESAPEPMGGREPTPRPMGQKGRFPRSGGEARAAEQIRNGRRTPKSQLHRGT
jgi:hypothetical protein